MKTLKGVVQADAVALIRFAEMLEQCILPLKQHRSHRAEVRLAEATNELSGPFSANLCWKGVLTPVFSRVILTTSLATRFRVGYPQTT